MSEEDDHVARVFDKRTKWFFEPGRSAPSDVCNHRDLGYAATCGKCQDLRELCQNCAVCTVRINPGDVVRLLAVQPTRIVHACCWDEATPDEQHRAREGAAPSVPRKGRRK